tara:strand:+ start:3180 stop:4019 length:840 start_codon:yes stop_codon:yes gene_type:complete
MISLKKMVLVFFDLFYFFKKFFLKRRFDKSKLMRILIYHDISSEKQLKNFESQIISLKKSFDFISPDEFEKSKNFIGKKLLLTFDDGFKSNRKVAEDILQKYNIKAIFFIPSEFIGLAKKSKEYDLILSNIYPKGPKEEDKSPPMDLEDLKFLLKQGHSIGCHTSTHPKLSNVLGEEELISEIVACKVKLEKSLSIKIKHFAFPFGTFQSINGKSLKIISNHYEFIHTGLRGNNLIKNKLLYRDAANPKIKPIRLKVFLNKGVDFIYKKKFNKLLSYLN